MRGVGVEGVASQIGALTTEKDEFIVSRGELLGALCHRFGVSREDAEAAIRRAKEVGAVREKDGMIELVISED
jgi:hypothetical protein